MSDEWKADDSKAAQTTASDDKSWKLLEKLVTNLCDYILAEFKAQTVNVTVKKFVIPQAQYVSVKFKKS